MNDQEIMALAAKAVGLEKMPGGEWGSDLWHPLINEKPWSPLTDDGDALRLAIYLGFCIQVLPSLATARVGNGDQDAIEVQWGFKVGLDAFTATRRAIVRAAAEIGRTME